MCTALPLMRSTNSSQWYMTLIVVLWRRERSEVEGQCCLYKFKVSPSYIRPCLLKSLCTFIYILRLPHCMYCQHLRDYRHGFQPKILGFNRRHGHLYYSMGGKFKKPHRLGKTPKHFHTQKFHHA